MLSASLATRLLFLFAGMLSVLQCNGGGAGPGSGVQWRRQGLRRQHNQGLDPVLHAAYMSLYMNHGSTMPPDDTEQANGWSSYTPAPLAPGEEVECQFNITDRLWLPGRCTRLGGSRRMAVCQSGLHLDFIHGDCESTLRARITGDGRK